jgi:tripartite ATP-independent transporter DctM subunit
MEFHQLLAIGSFPVLMLMLFAGFPITFTFMFIGLAIGYVAMGDLVFRLMNIHFYQVMTHQVFAAIPFFLFMGFLLERAGLMDKLFSSFQKLMAPIPGSLFVTMIITATIFAAATGIVGSSITLLCFMSAPAMARSNYNIPLGAGAIAGGGTLGILIPPSVMLVVMGPLIGVPVTNLFAGAIIPGIILSLSYITYALVRCFINPDLGPPLPMELRAKSYSALALDMLTGVVPVVVLIGFTLGAILAGVATPTEAAACGAFGALLLVFAYRKFTIENLKRALFNTAKLSAMILVMIAACNFWGAVFARLGGASLISDVLLSMNLPPMLMVVVILMAVFLLGWAMEWVPIVLVVMPLTMPIITELGIDPLWYAVMFAVVLQTSWLTPPVALSCYFIKGCIPQWKLWDIYKGMLQFVACQLVVIALLLAFPALITWLPNYLLK